MVLPMILSQLYLVALHAGKEARRKPGKVSMALLLDFDPLLGLHQ